MKINRNYKLGSRAIKTALAVAVCILMSVVFKREDALFSSIAAMICMQQTYNETFKTGLNRFIGTVLGGVLGYIVLEIIFLIPNYNNMFDIVIAPICILIVMYICNITNKKESIIISCIVLVSIVSQPEKNLGDAFFYVINRVVDTTIGIVIAMGINAFILPNKKTKKQ